MTNIHHTPGPWRTEQVKHGDHWVGNDEADIAVVEGFGPEFEEESDANARLIAAAPELLEACKAQAEELKALREWVAETYGQTKAAPVTGAAVAEQVGRAAIAKATGEQP